MAFSIRVQTNCTRIIKVKEKKRYELEQLDNKKRTHHVLRTMSRYKTTKEIKVDYIYKPIQRYLELVDDLTEKQSLIASTKIF